MHTVELNYCVICFAVVSNEYVDGRATDYVVAYLKLCRDEMDTEM